MKGEIQIGGLAEGGKYRTRVEHHYLINVVPSVEVLCSENLKTIRAPFSVPRTPFNVLRKLINDTENSAFSYEVIVLDIKTDTKSSVVVFFFVHSLVSEKSYENLPMCLAPQI